MGKIIGIDLGTTNCCVSVLEGGGELVAHRVDALADDRLLLARDLAEQLHEILQLPLRAEVLDAELLEIVGFGERDDFIRFAAAEEKRGRRAPPASA